MVEINNANTNATVYFPIHINEWYIYYLFSSCSTTELRPTFPYKIQKDCANMHAHLAELQHQNNMLLSRNSVVSGIFQSVCRLTETMQV